MQIGTTIQVSAYKANGACYRSWDAVIEAISPESIITIAPVGQPVKDIRGDWVSTSAVRTYYWLDKPYSLLEVYKPNGELEEIYINISSLVGINDSRLWFTDYELDVVLKPPGPAFLADEDEFAKAAVEYGYSGEFQHWCYQTAGEALAVANLWKVKGTPIFTGP